MLLTVDSIELIITVWLTTITLLDQHTTMIALILDLSSINWLGY